MAASPTSAQPLPQQQSQFGPDDFQDLQGLEIRKASIDTEISTLEGPYNVVYLDYVGHLSSGKKDTIEYLISKPELLEEDAILFVTLSNRPLDRARSAAAGFGEDQEAAVQNIVDQLDVPGVDIHFQGAMPYSGGTNGQENTEMLLMQIRVKKILENETRAQTQN